MVAKSLENILENNIMKIVLDRSQPIDEIIEEVNFLWKADLEKRKPAPAYVEGVDGQKIYEGSDFDLFTFLNALSERNAVINIPDYENLAPKSLNPNQKVVSRENRHGEILGVISNKNVHSFSVRINDYQVIQKNEDESETVGAPRNFALTDYSGKLYDGWTSLEFSFTKKEREFLEKHDLIDGERLEFENFVHPNLAFAFYGSRYLTTKALSERISDEASHYRKIAKSIKDEGIFLWEIKPPMEKEELPQKEKPSEDYKKSPEKKEVQKIKVPCLESNLILPEFSGEYLIIGLTENGETKEYSEMPSDPELKKDILRHSEQRAKTLTYSVAPKINSSVRAVELAYFLYGFSGEKIQGNEKNPSWEIPEWERDYKTGPRSRTLWNALHLNENVTLAYRLKETTVTLGN